MSDVALRPKFETKDFDRLQKLKLNGLLQNYDQPTVIASRAFSKFSSTPGRRIAGSQEKHPQDLFNLRI